MPDALNDAADHIVARQVRSSGSDSNALPCEWPYELFVDNPVEAGIRVGSTAIVCTALIQTPGFSDKVSHQEAVKRAVHFMINELEENPQPGSRRGGGTPVWAHIYGLEFFLLALRKEIFEDPQETRIREVAKYLIRCLEASTHGWPAGGWNYQGIEPCKPFMTGAALLALYQANDQGFEVNADVIEESLHALELTRSKAGSFAYSGGFIPLDESPLFDSMRNWASKPGSIGRACISELSLYRAGRSDVQKLRAAVEAFFEHWDALVERKGTEGHGGPHHIASYYIMFAHRYAAMAIEALPEDERPELRLKMQTALWKLRDDGHWNESNNPRNAAYSTAMAMLALMAPDAESVPDWTAPWQR